MREGRPSITAMCVAYARGAASAYPMTVPALHDDAVASHLLSRRLRPLVPRGRTGQALARALTFGLVDHVALRTAAIDAALDELGPFPQLVILGAGLDTRAYRLTSLARTRVFEVDHPASQASKIAAVAPLTPRALALHHVAADFLRDDVGDLLARSGHDADAPTAWIMEGLTMYLPEATTRRLLAVVARRSVRGSMLAMTYLRPPGGPVPSLLRRATQMPLRIVGEPFAAEYAPEATATLLRSAGLEPESDTDSSEWAMRFGASALLARPLATERLAVARL